LYLITLNGSILEARNSAEPRYWTTKLVYLVNFCMATSWKPGTVLSLVSLRLLAILFSSSVYSLHYNAGLAELSMYYGSIIFSVA
jgi:hypothetical protein